MNWLQKVSAGFYESQGGYWLALWIDMNGNSYRVNTTHHEWAWSNKEMLRTKYSIDLDEWYASRLEEEIDKSYDSLLKDEIRSIAYKQEIDESQVRLSEQDQERIMTWAQESADDGINLGIEVVDKLISEGWIRVAQRSVIHFEGDDTRGNFFGRCEDVLHQYFKYVWTNAHSSIIVNNREINSGDLRRLSLKDAIEYESKVNSFHISRR